MSLSFILLNPRHHIYKAPDGLLREDLVFPSARINKSQGPVLIVKEYGNGEYQEKFSTRWVTTNVADEEFYGNWVTLHNLDNPLMSKMTEWNNRNPKDRYGDSILLNSSDGLNIHIHLATDQFCRVVQTRWKENFINLTVRADQSLKELKWGLSKAETTAMKEGTEEIGPDGLKIEITRFEIQIEPLKTKIESQPIGATPLLRRLLFGLGR